MMTDEQHQLKEPMGSKSDSIAERREGGRHSFARSDEARQLGESFADPNALDDTRLGESFAETNFSGKKHKAPLTARIHKPASYKPVWILVGVILLLALLGGLAGYLPRHRRDKTIDQQAQTQAGAKPVVEVQRVVQVQSQQGLVLPGTTIPMTEAYIYARANGYLKKRYVDIGDHVVKGQLLGTIDAPDLDAQVAQARQQLAQAEQQLQQQRSQLALASVTVNRYRVLVAKGVFSRQEGDTQETNYASNLANVAAAQRNVDAYRDNLNRNIALQSYESIRAPFRGIITQRNVDVGALISGAGSTGGPISGPAPQGQTSASGGSGQAGQSNTAGITGNTSSAATPGQSPGQGGALFGVAQVGRLRILVSVPEGYSTVIHAGGKAQLNFEEYPGVLFTGNVTRTADSVDPNTRTMLTEVQVDNKRGRLKSGMYAVVTFPPTTGLGGPLMITGDALIIRNDQTAVATVVDGKIQVSPVVVGRDFGSAVEIVSGVNAGDLVVSQVTDEVVPGIAVQIHESKPATDTPVKPPAQNTPSGGTTRYGNLGITDQDMQGQAAQQNHNGAGGGKNGGGGSNGGGGQSKP